MHALSNPAFTRRPVLVPADAMHGDAITGTVIEIVSFRTLPGISQAAFLQAARATEAVLARQPGFIRRRLLQGPDGGWSDVIEWQSMALATAATKVVLADPAFALLLAAIDAPTVQMQHLPVLWQMGD